MRKIVRRRFLGSRHVFFLFCLFGIPPFAMLLTASAPAGDKRKLAEIPVGKAHQEVDVGGTRFTLYTYKPKHYQKGPLLLVFHGAKRDAESIRDSAIAVADQCGGLVVAPLFTAKRFPRGLYQDGGLLTEDRKPTPPKDWTWQYVPKLVQEVRRLEKRLDLPYYLLAHSGGGQFVERLAGFVQTDAKRIVAANPGTHLFPSRDFPYPYGFGGLPPELSNDAALKRYLAQPLTLYLGTHDTKHGKEEKVLDQSPLAEKQGAFRYERGLNVFRAAEKLAREKKWEFNWRLVEAKGVGHSDEKMFANPQCEIALFGKKGGGAPER